MNNVEGQQLPRFRCHKVVQAARITRWEQTDFNKGVTLWLDGSKTVEKSAEWFHKHQPETGGYYVVYDNDYASYSPAKAFEEGYSPIKEGGAEPAIVPATEAPGAS